MGPDTADARSGAGTLTVRTRETYAAVRWYPGTPVAGVRLCRINGLPEPEYLLFAWPNGVEGQSISPGDWVLTAHNGFRFRYDDALFRRVYETVSAGAGTESTEACDGTH